MGADASARIAKTGETVQEIRDTGYATDIDPAVTHVREHEAELGVTQQRAMTYVPPAREQQYNPDADYQRAVLANTRVVPAAAVDARGGASASRLGAETARFQTELAIAQQAAVNQVRAQQQADAEAAERAAPVAVAQYIARPWNATARTSHR